MSAWCYEFTINNHRMFNKPVIPKRMNKELQEIWNKQQARKHAKKNAKRHVNKCGERGVIRQHRGTENKEYLVRLSYDFKGSGKLETSLGKGWEEFVTSNKIRYFDRILLLLEDTDDMYYRVRIWLGEIEITVTDPHVLIENDGTISDVDETEYVPMEFLFVPPSFIFSFSKGYLKKPQINVPVTFARKNFEGLEDPTDLEISASRTWNATMRFNFTKDNKIAMCTIRKGVPEMVAGEEIELGEKFRVELEGTDPKPVRLTIRFT